MNVLRHSGCCAAGAGRTPAPRRSPLRPSSHAEGASAGATREDAARAQALRAGEPPPRPRRARRAHGRRLRAAARHRMIGLPDSVIFNTGPLSPADWALLNCHPERGADLLHSLPGMGRAAEFVRAHHERWDGEGYPDGLEREAIPLPSRVVAVCDAFVAIATDRPHRRGSGAEGALGIITQERGGQFDPGIVDCLVAALTGKEDARPRAPRAEACPGHGRGVRRPQQTGAGPRAAHGDREARGPTRLRPRVRPGARGSKLCRLGWARAVGQRDRERRRTHRRGSAPGAGRRTDRRCRRGRRGGAPRPRADAGRDRGAAPAVLPVADQLRGVASPVRRARPGRGPVRRPAGPDAQAV